MGGLSRQAFWPRDVHVQVLHECALSEIIAELSRRFKGGDIGLYESPDTGQHFAWDEWPEALLLREKEGNDEDAGGRAAPG